LLYDPDIDERAILSVARRHRDADEIAQEARLWVLCAPEPKPMTRGERVGYVQGIARHAALRLARKRELWGREGSGDGLDRVSAEDATEAVDTRLDIDRLVRPFPERVRMWCRYRAIAGMSRKEAARKLGVSVKAMESQVTRGHSRRQ
jgi:DNA-directed RNA polymerase specialized sigma24 family protein